MSVRWPNKDPDEILDYNIDWSRRLEGATISTVSWFIDDENRNTVPVVPVQIVNGIQMVGSTFTQRIATIYLSLGKNNVEYNVTCRVQDNQGRQFDRTARLRVKER